MTFSQQLKQQGRDKGEFLLKNCLLEKQIWYKKSHWAFLNNN